MNLLLMDKSAFHATLRAAAAQEFAGIPQEDAIDHVFTPTFESRMARLVKLEKRRLWHWVNTAGKRAAAIAILVLFLFSAAMSVEAVREPVIRFFVEIYEKYIEVVPEGDTTKSITYEYSLKEVPEGYTVTDYMPSPAAVTTFYEDMNGNMLILDQAITGGGTSLSLDNEKGTITETTVGDIQVLVYQRKGMIILVWFCEGYELMLTHYGEMRVETLLDLIPKVQ